MNSLRLRCGAVTDENQLKNRWSKHMQHKEVDCATIAVANSTGMSGAETADEIRLRIGKGRIVGNIVRYGMVGVAIALLPLRQAIAGDNDNRAILPTGFLDVSTIPPAPASQDKNPYGVAFVPPGFPQGGKLNPGDTLVSNFNDPANTQATGRTIIKVEPDGQTSLFFQGTSSAVTPSFGLTTALGVLKRGFVLVGNAPLASNGMTVQSGSLLFLDRNGNLISPTPYTNVNGPWDLTIDDEFDHAKVFISNVLDGTVIRLDLAIGPTSISVMSAHQIASGYQTGLDSAALVVGPTGLAYDEKADILYVASTKDNEIFAVPEAGKSNQSHGTGAVIYKDNVHLHGPLALALAPNGHLLTSNGDAPSVNPPLANQLPSEIVEFTKDGKFVGQLSIDSVTGGAFGIAIVRSNEDRVHFAAVNDDDNTIIVLSLKSEEKDIGKD
jgi:hypothetical protein